MKKIIITVGLPGAGKTHWSKKYRKTKSDIVKICKDDLRNMLFDGEYSDDNEKFINEERDRITKDALSQDKSVIWADTNLSIIHQQRAKEIASVHGAQFIIKDFTDIPIQQCVQNDLRRPNSVGEKVIRQMYNKYLKPSRIIFRDERLPLALICDIDQTLSMPMGRDLFDTEKVDEDKPNIPIVEIIKSIYGKFHIILISARNEKAQVKTKKWLEKHNIMYDKLILCGKDKITEARDLKEKAFQKEIEGKYNVLFAIDDDPEVCRMWQEMNIEVLKVGDPDNF